MNGDTSRVILEYIPVLEERNRWVSIDPVIQQEIHEEAETLRSCSWDSLSLSLYLTFHRSGDRLEHLSHYEKKRKNLMTLALAEALENHRRFVEDIANGLWNICEESTLESVSFLADVESDVTVKAALYNGPENGSMYPAETIGTRTIQGRSVPMGRRRMELQHTD
jgi:hypothetical protein